jgi:hypothetical protein
LAGTALLMVIPEHVFIEGLKLFPHIRLYANAYVPSSPATAGALIHCLCSINDLTVPYMTAYVDLEDPFLNHGTDGLIVYVAPHHLHARSLSIRDYDDKYFPIIKSFTIPDTPPPKRKTARGFTWEWFKHYKPPLPPRFQGPFPYNMVSVQMNVAETSHIIDSLTGCTRPAPDYLPYLRLPCSGLAFHLISSFPLPHQAPRG